jgi:HK97 family phage major capsid protein
MKLHELRSAHAKAAGELITLAADGGEAFETKKAEVVKLADQIRRTEEAQALAAETAQPAPGQEHKHVVPAQAKAPEMKGAKAAMAVLALASTKGSFRDAADYVEKTFGPEGAPVAKALGVSVGSAGGLLLQEDMASEVIELLRPAAAVSSLQPRIVSMPLGTFKIPGMAQGASASYVGENANIPKSEQGFRAVNLVAKKLTALVPISNDMIRFPNVNTLQIVRDDMVDAIAQRGDLAMIRGNGGEHSPRGLLSFAAATPGGAGLLDANPTVNLQNITNDLGRMELALLQANVKMRRPGWIMAPRTAVFLMNLRDGNGNLVYSGEMSMGMLRGKPFRMTTQVPVNLDELGGGDESEIYLADFAEVFVGEAMGLELSVFDGATYFDGSQLVSGVSQDQQVIRAITQHDMDMRQASAVAVMKRVRWIS